MATSVIPGSATQSAAGMMSAADKTKLDGLPASAAKPDAIAIIVDGDTSGAAVAAGAYAYIKNNTHGLTEGLYRNKSSSAFPTSGGTANSTVFEAVSGGGINALNAQIAKLYTEDLTFNCEANVGTYQEYTNPQSHTEILGAVAQIISVSYGYAVYAPTVTISNHRVIVQSTVDQTVKVRVFVWFK